jgi:hypothetical protein
VNAYVLEIWQSVEHNGKFSHNVHREIIVHARNANEAKEKIALRPEHTKELPELKIEVGNEFVYSCKKIGTVEIRPFYVYSSHRYSPIEVDVYKANIKKELKPC